MVISHRLFLVLPRLLSLGLILLVLPPAVLGQTSLLTGGLIAFYPFNGNADNAGGDGMDGTFLTGASLGQNRFGTPSAAVLLDGINAPDKGVRITDTVLNAGQAGWTISLWFRSNNSSKAAQTLVNTVPHTGIGFGYNYEGTQRVHYVIGDGSNWAGVPNHLHSSSNSVAAGEWASAALVKDGNEVRLYLNGEFEGATIYNASGWDRSFSFYIGSVGTTPPSYEVFSGEIDDVRFYGRALSATDIKSLHTYEANLAGIRTAAAVAQVANGVVVGITVIDGGYGYTDAPMLVIAGGGGSGATATATVIDGVITGFTVTNGGSGYESAPNVAVEPPPFSPRLAVTVSRVKVSMAVVPGARYQLESSMDIDEWKPVGEPFYAITSELVQEFEVDAVGRYFRIYLVP